MNSIEAFLMFLVYILPFGGIGNIIFGITENNKSKIVLGGVYVLASLFIMGYLIYKAKKEKRKFVKDKKIKLLVGLFGQIIVVCVLMIVEFIILWHFSVPSRHIMATICISFVIMTIFFTLLQKIVKH